MRLSTTQATTWLTAGAADRGSGGESARPAASSQPAMNTCGCGLGCRPYGVEAGLPVGCEVGAVDALLPPEPEAGAPVGCDVACEFAEPAGEDGAGDPVASWQNASTLDALPAAVTRFLKAIECLNAALPCALAFA